MVKLIQFTSKSINLLIKTDKYMKLTSKFTKNQSNLLLKIDKLIQLTSKSISLLIKLINVSN